MLIKREEMKMNKSELMIKYISQKDIKELNKLKQSLNDTKVRVTCIGQYNNGKSSLLNALIRDKNNETFKVSDNRETILNKTLEYNNMIFVDTPGLNVQNNDDMEAMEAIKSSDINLFIHNINNGELNEVENDFLKNILKYWDNNIEDFIFSTIFVLTKTDELQNEQDKQKTIKKISQQINDIFGLEASIIAISSSDLLEGIRHNENELIEESNILDLENKLEYLSISLKDKITKIKQQRLMSHYDNLIKQLNDLLKEKNDSLNAIRNEKIERIKNLTEDVSMIEITLKNKYERLRIQ
ncbi:MAG: dynamin family protein [Aliarcobacter sp.]|jgi:GTP-binding protein EngB required for normal cell division|nr:dynamin family protein [Aliarcobacter sp.]